MDEDFEFLVLGATDYALGRMSYVVGEQCRILRRYWGSLSYGTKRIITGRVEAALVAGRVGMEIDRREWERLAEDLWR